MSNRFKQILSGGFQWQDNRRGLDEFARMMHKRMIEVYSGDHPPDTSERYKQLRCGWCIGDDSFRANMEELVEARIRQYDRRSYLGEETHRHDEREAERLLRFGLQALKVDAEELSNLKKSDARKKVVAWLIRKNTSVTNDWICERLSMGRASNLARHVNDIVESHDPDIDKMRRMMKKAF